MSGPRPHSFTAKLLSLDIGESMFLPESYDPMQKMPLRLERAVGTAMARNPAIVGRRFSTSRAVCVTQSPLQSLQGLMIKRDA